jgi:PKD repeat protein
MKRYSFFITLALVFFVIAGCTKGPKPVAAFIMDQTSAMAMDTIHFINQSTDAETYSWDFGDDSVSTLENPTHQFAKGGTYTVTLSANTEDRTNSTSQTITILPSMTGRWTSNFTYYMMDYHGLITIYQDKEGNLTGAIELSEGYASSPMASTSKITGTSVTIETINQSTKYTFKGTINSDLDYITGNFFIDGTHFGNWYAIKRQH